MHFNTKYINRGDSEKEIKDKVNYNFNQVLSFAVGHEGYIGPKGATGIPGPSGKIGATGNTGDRASEWFRGTTFPSQTPQEFDLWVDDSSSLGDIYKRDSSSWSYTGLSLFNSDYFEVYSGIVGPLGLTNKSAIGFNSTYTPDQTSLVISDTYFSTSDVNPNNSKLLISTEDQINTPILSFSKSNGGSTIDFPSFYWKNTGTLSNLIFKSPGKLSINSLLDLEISSDDPTIGGSLIIRGNSFSSTTQGNLNLIGDARIKLITDSSINPIIINSLNFGVNESKLYTKTLTKISWNVGDYALKSTPVTGSTLNYFGGISVNSDPTTSKVFDFTGMDGHSVLYGLPLGSVTSGNHKQTVFGASGGATAGSTGAPYSYHVKRLNNVSIVPLTTGRAIPYSIRNTTGLMFYLPINPTFDISNPTIWNSNMIVVTNNTAITGNAYILIPSSTTSSFEPIFYTGEGNEYRVYLNDETASWKIKGLIYNYIYESGTGDLSNRRVLLNFSSPCSYVDLFWAYVGSPTNPNGRIFWKTCSGSSGVLEVTNQFTVSRNSVPASSSR